MALPVAPKMPMIGNPAALQQEWTAAPFGPNYRKHLQMLAQYGNPNSAADQIMQGFPAQQWDASSLGTGLAGGQEWGGIWSMNPRALSRSAGRPGPLGGTK